MAAVDKTKTPQPAGVESVNRALALLACFREGDGSVSLSELAARTGFYKSTILRLCISLEAARFIVRLPDKSFAVGPEVLRLGSVYQKSLRIEERIRPVLKRVLETVGESASFFRRDGDKRICLFRENSARSIRDHVIEGEWLPMTTGAAGHVLEQFEKALGSEADLSALGRKLPFFSFGERDPEIAAAAVPVFWWKNGAVDLLGALGVSGPLGRFDAKVNAGIRASLLAEGRELSSQLGGPYDLLGIK